MGGLRSSVALPSSQSSRCLMSGSRVSCRHTSGEALLALRMHEVCGQVAQQLVLPEGFPQGIGVSEHIKGTPAGRRCSRCTCAKWAGFP